MEITSLGDLLDVQDLDLQIDRLLDRRQSLPELAAYRQAHENQQALEAELTEASTALKALELDFDKSEGELEMLESKLSEHETRLYAGGMSARETEYMRLEVQSLRGQKEAMEERVLGMLDQVDPARDSVVRLNAESGFGALDQGLAGEGDQGGVEGDRRRVGSQGRAQEGGDGSRCPPTSSRCTRTLRQSKEGVAIGRFEHGVCGGCHMALSAQEQAEALGAEIPRCVHCRRILVP